MAVLDDILNEFPGVDAATWDQLFIKETRQTETGLRTSQLGFTYKPFYTADASFQKQVNTLRQLLAQKGPGWNINRSFKTGDAAAQNKKILEALNKGVSSITLDGSIAFPQQLQALLKEVQAGYIEVNFTGHTTPQLATWYMEWCKQHSVDISMLNGACHADPIGAAARAGGFAPSNEEAFSRLHALYKIVNAEANALKCITIDAGVYHYAGASLVQTLAYTLSHAVEYLNYFTQQGEEAEAVLNRMVFIWPAGREFFADIAALRALQLLWHNACAHITGNKNKLYNATIQAHTSVFSWSVADIHTNMLRATTQAMAAITGGANSVYVMPYNVVSTAADDFAGRIAVNVQLLLREETFMDKVADPAGGSYFTENLTAQLTANALTLFKQTEAGGGLLAGLKSNAIQTAIGQNAALLKQDLEQGNMKILGLNLYPNKSETRPQSLDLFEQHAAGAKGFEPLQAFRLAALAE